MSKNVRWGILGPGAIAQKFAEGLQSADAAELVAVGSRSAERADAFGDKWNVPRRHGSYEQLAADPDVDAVYVATPHPFHKDHSLLCLEAGKAVLCEKPFTVNAAEAEQVVQTARQRNLFCMEAMWSRFLPTVTKAREIIAAGAIGDVRMVLADFGFRAAWNPTGRLLNPDLAGGGLLDVGVYPVSLASMVLGTPTTITGQAHLGATGVDEQAGVVLGYAGGALALIACGVQTTTPHEARLLGTDGSIYLHPAWWCGAKLTLTTPDGSEEFDLPAKGNGYTHEAEEVGRCLAAGATESEIMTLDETLSVMRTLDAIRAQWPLRYPME